MFDVCLLEYKNRTFNFDYHVQITDLRRSNNEDPGLILWRTRANIVEPKQTVLFPEVQNRWSKSEKPFGVQIRCSKGISKLSHPCEFFYIRKKCPIIWDLEPFSSLIWRLNGHSWPMGTLPKRRMWWIGFEKRSSLLISRLFDQKIGPWSKKILSSF